MEEILKQIRQDYKGILSDEQIEKTCEYWKEKLTAFELKTKQEFLKRILPEEHGPTKERVKYQNQYNTCRKDIIRNAEKDGVTIK